MAKREPKRAANPYAQRAARTRSLVAETVTDNDVRDMVGAIVKAAKNGNLAASKLVLAYIVGNPEAPQDPDTVKLKGMKIASDKSFAELSAGILGG